MHITVRIYDHGPHKFHIRILATCSCDTVAITPSDIGEHHDALFARPIIYPVPRNKINTLHRETHKILKQDPLKGTLIKILDNFFLLILIYFSFIDVVTKLVTCLREY